MKFTPPAAQLYTIREHTQTAEDFAKSISKIRDIGYIAVQVSAIGPISDNEVLRITKENGLKVCITHIGYDRLRVDIDSVIEQHHLWQTKHVAIGSMPQDFRNDGEDGYKHFAEIANQIGEKLHNVGLTFSYHNHSFEFVKFGNRTGLDILFDETDPRYLQAELDTYWVQHGGGDPASWVVHLRNRMPLIHLKDMVMLRQPDSTTWSGVEQVMAEVGAGNLNWPEILTAFETAQVEWYAVE